MSVQKRLVSINILAISILLIAVLGTILLVLHFQRLNTAIEETKIITRGIIVLLNFHNPNKDSKSNELIIQEYEKQINRNIQITDEQGNILGNMSTSLLPSVPTPEILQEIKRTLHDGNVRTVELIVPGLDKHFLIYPWEDQGIRKGAILIEYGYEDVVQLTTQRIIIFSLFGILFGLLTIRVVQIYTQRYILRPIQELMRGVEKIRSGDLDFRFDKKNKDEFGKIEEAFNSMTQAIGDSYKRKQMEIEELQKLNELKIVGKLSSSLIATSGMNEILKIALEQICPAINAHGGSIILVDSQGKMFSRRVNYGLTDEYQKLTNIHQPMPISGKYSGIVFRSGKPLIVKNVYTEPIFEDYRNAAKVEKYTGFACIPMIAKNQNLGILNLYFKNEIELKENELGLLIILADEVSLAILRAQYEESIETRARQMTVLHEFSQKIGSNLKLEYIYEVVLEQAVRSMNADYGIIRLLGKDENELQVVYTRGISDKEKEKLPLLHVGLGVAGDVAKFAKPVYIEDVSKDARLRGYTLLEEETTYLGVPLRVGEKVIGVLSCMTRKSMIFNEDEIAFFSILAAEAGIAIENAKLYDETRELTLIDPLTQLGNVRKLHPQLEGEITRMGRYNRFLSFAMLDIDHFKKYNDMHGHPRGDFVLQRVADLIKKQVRDIDFVFRYGGEEFCIIFVETEKSAASKVLERIRNEIAEFPFYGEETQPEGNLTISSGLATFPLDATNKADLIAKADKALYLAKALGRNRVCNYEENPEN